MGKANINDDNATTTTTTNNSSSNNSFGYMREKITGIMDEQRLHRLEQCRVLQDVLAECRRGKNKNRTAADTDTTDNPNRRLQLEDVPAGIRMVRYFDWRDYKAPTTTATTPNTGDTKQKQNHCLREEHSVWACRAVALQCGAPLAQLKSCFAETGPDSILSSSNQTAYAPLAVPVESNKIPCQWQQQSMGDCVAAAAVQLQERQSHKKQ
jgi:hypothetical protein